jgi:hypothetical protein
VVATVEHVVQQVDGSVPSANPTIKISVPPVVRTSVSGVVRNTLPVAAVVPPFPVNVTFTDGPRETTTTVTASALPRTVTLAPGAGLQWTFTVDNPPRTPIPSGADAKTPAWRWEDPALAAACPR